jgi:hypothetical protein
MLVTSILQYKGPMDIFQQYFTPPPYFHVAAAACLDAVFPQRMTGHRRQIHWPSHSPDLMPLDFHFQDVQGGSNMTGTNCDLFTHK